MGIEMQIDDGKMHEEVVSTERKGRDEVDIVLGGGYAVVDPDPPAFISRLLAEKVCLAAASLTAVLWSNRMLTRTAPVCGYIPARQVILHFFPSC